jgi:uncharacterized C2H2 Zn-finger protein
MSSKAALAAARKLRIKIHDMGEDNIHACQRGSNKENARWLDQVSAEDAPIIDSHFAELVEAAEKAVNRLVRCMPCPHDNADTRLGNGKIWARCEDCGVTFQQEHWDNIRHTAKNHEACVERLRAELEKVK